MSMHAITVIPLQAASAHLDDLPEPSPEWEHIERIAARAVWSPRVVLVTGGRAHHEVGKRAFPDVKRALPFRLYGRTRPGEMADSTAVPVVY